MAKTDRRSIDDIEAPNDQLNKPNNDLGKKIINDRMRRGVSFYLDDATYDTPLFISLDVPSP